MKQQTAKTIVFGVLYAATIVAVTLVIMEKANAQYHGTQPTLGTGMINTPRIQTCYTTFSGSSAMTTCF